MSNMCNELKVGFFVFAGIVLFAVSLFMLGDFSFKKNYQINVIFNDVGGLANKSVVKLNGVEVGRIKDLIVYDSKVKAEILINEGVKIYRNAKFYIGSTSIIGSKFIQIEQGNPLEGVIKAGETVYAVNRKPLEDMILELSDNINRLIKDISNNGEFARNLNKTVENLRDITSGLNQIISSNSDNIDNIISKLDDTMNNVKSLTAKLDKILTNIDEGRGTIGALISDEKTKDDVKQSISNIKEATRSLKDFVSKTSKIKTFWKWDFKYEPSAHESYNDVGLKIYVNDNKYYYAGGSNLLNIRNRPHGVSYEMPNRIDAYIGWDYPLWGFYAGIIKGTGGFGLLYTPFYYDDFLGRLSFNLEANEFSRNRYIKGRWFNDARYDLGVIYKVNNNISGSVKITDLLEVKRLNLSTRVLFEDKDLANLLGLVGGAQTGALIKK